MWGLSGEFRSIKCLSVIFYRDDRCFNYCRGLGEGELGQEGGGQRAEGRRQRAEGRGQKAEGRGQKAEGRGQKAEGKHPFSCIIHPSLIHSSTHPPIHPSTSSLIPHPSSFPEALFALVLDRRSELFLCPKFGSLRGLCLQLAPRLRVGLAEWQREWLRLDRR
jgi:hypothetical protein